MKTVHVIPVPRGMDADDAFEEIRTFGRLVEYRWWRPQFRWPLVKWAVVEDDE